MSFPIAARVSRWRKRESKIFSNSELVGYYSVDAYGNYLADSSQLLYYNPPSQGNVYLDLNHGIESAVRSSGSSREAYYMFKWIKENHTKIEAPVNSNRWNEVFVEVFPIDVNSAISDYELFSNQINPDFVCSRKLLLTLLSTPVTINEPWWIRAAKWKGSIYLCFNKVERIYDVSYEEMTKFAYWGSKFEQYMLSGMNISLLNNAPDKFPDSSKPVLESNQFRCLYQRRFGSQTILFTVAMKGVSSKKPLSDPLPLEGLEFVDLKITKVIENGEQKRRFRKYKLFKWWAQNFLTNTNKLLCGFKDDEGIVRNLKSFSLNDMIAMAEGWNPMACTDFCEAFLTWVSKTVVNDCDRTVYIFKREAHANCVKVTQLPSSSKPAVIPSWFMDETK